MAEQKNNDLCDTDDEPDSTSIITDKNDLVAKSSNREKKDKKQEKSTEEIDDEKTENEEEDVDLEDDADTDDDAFSDDKGDEVYVRDPGELIQLPFLKRGYNWRQLMPETFMGKKHLDDPIEIAPDLIQSGESLTVTDVRKRCRYIGKNQNNKNHMNKCSEFIEGLVNKMKVTMQVMICKFFMHVATHLKFGIDSSTGICETYDDFKEAVANVETDKEKKKVQIIIYLVFDFMLHYQTKVAEIVCERLNVVIVDKETKVTKQTKKKEREKRDFVYKLVTYVVNNQRKNINDISSASANLTYTITRWGIHLDNAKDKYDGRKKKHFYDWMVVLNKVRFCCN
jgi:hypothetical protein